MRILITAGPTREYIDPIRFISNASSGKMGFAIAEAAARRGHQVILISGPVYLPTPMGVQRVDVVSADQMLAAAQAQFDSCEAAIMSAAVSDYRAKVRVEQKMEREKGGLCLELESTRDICAQLGADKGPRIVVGFALEDHDHHRRAEDKLVRKHCDAVVLNRPDNVGIDEAGVEVYVGGRGWQPFRRGTKLAIADYLIELTEQLAGAKRSESAPSSSPS